MVTADQLRQYAARDWQHLSNRTVMRAALRYRVGGPLECLRMSQELYAHAKRVVPGFPSPASRAKDHADHLALLEKLDAVAHLFIDA